MGGRLQIAFGKRRVPGSAPGPLAPGHAAIGRGSPPIRLNSPGWLDPPPELVAAMEDRAALRLLCRDGLAALTGGFSATARRTIERYFEHLASCHSLPDGPLVPLTHPSDRYFAALLPMPEVRVVAGPDATPARADLAFWDGHRLTLVRFGDAARDTPRETRALDALRRDSPVPVGLVRAAEVRDADLAAILPADLLDCSRNAALPVHGPVRLGALQPEPWP